MLKHPSGSLHRLFIDLGFILQDGGAHEHVFHVKGDGATRMCFICRNLMAFESTIIGEDGDAMLTCSIIGDEGLDMASDADVRGTITRLEQKHDTMSKNDFAMWEQACGFNYKPHGLLQDRALWDILQPVRHFCHLWMHCLLVGGVFQTSGVPSLGIAQCIEIHGWQNS